VSSLRDELDEIRRTLFKPKKEQKIWEWIQENCKLLPESGAKLKRS
jgi:flagellar biosynthesis chaperone FliJ